MVIDTKINEEVKSVLATFGDKYLSNGSLKKTAVIDDLNAYKPDLISAILKSELLTEHYTENVDGNVIFKLNQFVQMFQYKGYWEDSYTKYANKVGLTAGGKFIDENADVVLDFPFKDTVLKAGMTKEDVEDDDLAIEEPFLNETIASAEIDTLLAPKIFTNVMHFGDNRTDLSNTADDNLIIKGNNLVVLHSLTSSYTGKIKLIYLDPPYNTGNDSFAYNDSYNHSTWLTFMKNRLEIARELLTDDGTVWINIDVNEAHYLKVLADNIFGRDNSIASVVWQKIHSTKNDAKYFSDNQDNILIYGKHAELVDLNSLPRTKKMDDRYTNPDDDERGPWQSGDLVAQGERTNGYFDIVSPLSGKVFNVPKGKHWVYSKVNLEQMISENRVWFGKQGTSFPRKKRFLTEVTGGLKPSTIWLNDEVGHNQEAKRESIKLLGSEAFDTPKPERLIQRILRLGSNEGDLVLDFFMGSATTQAAAMKMNRRFIGIEQMDYINTVSVPRLQKVIDGEQGGISKDVDWQGGGSFTYVELMEKNQGFLKDILATTNANELDKVYDRIKDVADFDFRVDLEKYIETKSELTFEERKRLLVQILDKNQLYYNYADIDDKDVRDLTSDEDYEFNKQFYSKGE